MCTSAQDLVSGIHNNRVVVICGETGCGKTTQVPQYIMDEMLEKMAGATCNIVCTQPRRIAAIGVAERVAQERGEALGDSCGYQIRHENRFPTADAKILFCTTGLCCLWRGPGSRSDGAGSES